MKGVPVRSLVVALAILSLGALPAVGGPPVPDPGAPGPFLAGHTSFVLTDSSRPGGPDFEFRPIPVEVWYPVDPADVTEATPQAVYPLDILYGYVPDSVSSDWEKYGIDRAWQEPLPSAARPFPLVVFSPGWGAAAWWHISVATRLATHGFVVAVMYHYGDQFWGWEPPYDHLAVASWNRPRDVSFVLTDLLARNEGGSGDLLSGTMRPDEVAASGWSLGGYAAMVLAGGDDSVCDMVADYFPDPPDSTCTPSFPDPRIRAIAPLDGSSQLLHFYELSRVAIPALGMGEEWSYLALDPGWEAWQARHHAAFQGRPSYRADVFNSNHQTFSDFCEVYGVAADLGLVSPGGAAYVRSVYCDPFIPRPDAQRLIGKYLVSFFRTHLSGEPGYQSILTPGYALTREPAVEFFVTEKKSPKSIFEDYPSSFVYFPHQPGSAQFRAEKDPPSTLRVLRATEKR